MHGWVHLAQIVGGVVAVYTLLDSIVVWRRLLLV